MKFNRSMVIRVFVLISLIASLTILSNKIQADTGSCGGVTITLPFNDVMASPFFCQIAAAYYSGLTNGTTATTFSPDADRNARANGSIYFAHPGSIIETWQPQGSSQEMVHAAECR